MRNHPLPSPASCTKPRAWALFIFVGAALAGCNKAEPWDAEFTCAGQEQSIATFAGEAPDKAVRKDYPFTIDFHIRAKTAMVRSSLVKVSDRTGDVMHFEAKGTHVWVNGQFDPRSMRISLVEERLLQIEGRQQQVRTSGQYACTAVGSGRTTT